MKNAFSNDKLSESSGSFTSKVKNLISGSPLVKRRRSLSLTTTPGQSTPPMFGVPLATLVARENGEIPAIITKIVSHIEKHGLDNEGIYRVNGNAKSIEKMKISFDKFGDCNFQGEDISAIAGLLKLFLRELPDGVVPQDKVSHFVLVQQANPTEVTTDFLSQLKAVIHTLPPANYSTLKYLVHHLALVAKHTQANKMTPVSLAIVFGPNLFHCGEGLQALQLQGFSNSIVCRLLVYQELLFGGVELAATRSKTSPVKPRPYSEHMAQRRVTIGNPISPHRNSSFDGDLERSYSEKSIDEAILERSHGTVSPGSPSILEEDHVTPKTPPARPPPPKFKASPLRKAISEGEFPTNCIEEFPGEEEAPIIKPVNEDGFQRQYAKRGLKFKPQPGSEHDSAPAPVQGQGSPGQSRSLTRPPDTSAPLDESLKNSTASYTSSPGASPHTSPSITPRSSRVVSSLVDQSVHQYLFQQPGPSNTPKADVYGLLLPKTPASLPTSHQPTMRQSNTTNKKLRNRKSALYGEQGSVVEGQSSELGSPLGEADVKLLSVSPERHGQVVESRQGKLAELVAKFEETDSGVVVSQEVGVVKRKPDNKAFEFFEKQGALLQMPRVSFASTNTTISPSSSPQGSPTHTGSHQALRADRNSSNLRSTSTDEAVSPGPLPPTPVSTGSDDVFSSPAHNTSDLDYLTMDQHTLQHTVLTRAKGPANRRLPSRTKSLSVVPDNQPIQSITSHETAVANNSTLESKSGDVSGDLVGPKEQKSVADGWQNSVDEIDGTFDSKEVAKKIHSLKKQVKSFEVKFVSEHKRKPSNQERAPVRHLIEQVQQLKKMLKSTAGDHQSTSSLPQNTSDQPTTPLSTPLLDSEKRLNKRSGSVDTGPTSDQATVATGLTHTLNKIMKSLEAKRNSQFRPNELPSMSSHQLAHEKRDIQKALLQFEKAHGRPSTRDEKEIMRPLYDRYRLVKKLATTKQRLQPRLSLGAMETSTDTLPSITLLHSSTSLALTLPATPELKSASRKKEKSQILSETEIKTAPLDELIEQNKLLELNKKSLRVKLKEFETDFEATHGRGVEKSDRGTMSDQYSQYKEVKTKLKLVASQLTKLQPQKTI